MNDTAPVQQRMEQLAHEFPVNEEWLWANHAAISPWPRSTREAVSAFALENQNQGAVDYGRWLRHEADLRQRLARLIGAASDRDVALLPNTTEGINLVARGLNWHSGDNIVTTSSEFPSNHLAWAALKRHGVELRPVDIRLADNAEQALIQAMDQRTRLLAVSSVQWTDGFRLELGQLGEVCRRRQVLFFVDAIQELGALPLAVERDHIDVLVAGSHKWQMGAEGLALCCIGEALRQTIQPLKLGWRMFRDPFEFDPTKQSEETSARRYESGTPNTLGQIALNASLGLYEQWGTDWVATRIRANTNQLIETLGTVAGLRVASATEPERRSGIVAIGSDRYDSSALEQALRKHRIMSVARGGLLRLSPHYYQGEQDMSRLCDALIEVHTR